MVTFVSSTLYHLCIFHYQLCICHCLLYVCICHIVTFVSVTVVWSIISLFKSWFLYLSLVLYRSEVQRILILNLRHCHICICHYHLCRDLCICHCYLYVCIFHVWEFIKLSSVTKCHYYLHCSHCWNCKINHFLHLSFRFLCFIEHCNWHWHNDIFDFTVTLTCQLYI